MKNPPRSTRTYVGAFVAVCAIALYYAWTGEHDDRKTITAAAQAGNRTQVLLSMAQYLEADHGPLDLKSNSSNLEESSDESTDSKKWSQGLARRFGIDNPEFALWLEMNDRGEDQNDISRESIIEDWIRQGRAGETVRSARRVLDSSDPISRQGRQMTDLLVALHQKVPADEPAQPRVDEALLAQLNVLEPISQQYALAALDMKSICQELIAGADWNHGPDEHPIPAIFSQNPMAAKSCDAELNLVRNN